MNRLLASVQKIRLYNLKNGYAYSSGPEIVILKVRSDILVALKWNLWSRIVSFQSHTRTCILHLLYLDMKKKFCLRFKEHCNLLCVDDKHKVKVWELGYPVAAAERGKSVLVAMGKRFEVSDNDFTKFSITPRIALSMKTPDSIEETFYVGKVSVILKESVFELSSP